MAGLVFGWLRATYHIFEGVPEPAMATMNSVGLTLREARRTRGSHSA